jgi:hypothetical protein
MTIIDLTFIVRENYSSYLGSPIFITAYMDLTISYGVILDLLRIRQKFCITKWICVLGKGAQNAIPKHYFNSLYDVFEQLDIPLILNSTYSFLDICSNICDKNDDIISSNSNILQIAGCYSHIILIQDNQHIIFTISEEVMKQIGIDCNYIATYNALTFSPPLEKPLFTKRQAIRLIELYGDLNKIYAATSNIPTSVVSKLSSNRDSIFKLYDDNIIHNIDKKITFPHAKSLSKDQIVPFFKKYGFYSLIRLLDDPPDFQVNKYFEKNQNIIRS